MAIFDFAGCGRCGTYIIFHRCYAGFYLRGRRRCEVTARDVTSRSRISDVIAIIFTCGDEFPENALRHIIILDHQRAIGFFGNVRRCIVFPLDGITLAVAFSGIRIGVRLRFGFGFGSRLGVSILGQCDTGKTKEAAAVGCAFCDGKLHHQLVTGRNDSFGGGIPHFMNSTGTSHTGSNVDVGVVNKCLKCRGRISLLHFHVPLTHHTVAILLIVAATIQGMNVQSHGVKLPFGRQTAHLKGQHNVGRCVGIHIGTKNCGRNGIARCLESLIAAHRCRGTGNGLAITVDHIHNHIGGIRAGASEGQPHSVGR